MQSRQRLGSSLHAFTRSSPSLCFSSLSISLGGVKYNYVRTYTILSRYRFPPKQQEEQTPPEAEDQAKPTTAIQNNQQKKRKQPLVWKLRPPPPEVTELPLHEFVQPESPRSLRVAVLGAPNAGKSTLVNSLVGDRVSAVCRKAMTTREEVMGIATEKEAQLIFVDTPGVVPKRMAKRYGSNITTTGWTASEESDLVLVIVDVLKKLDEMSTHIIDRIKKEKDTWNKDIVLVLNKMDKLPSRDKALHKIDTLNESGVFTDTFLVSALKGTNLDMLKEYLVKRAVPREWEFPPDMQGAMSTLERVEEAIRESLYNRLNREIPYTVTQKNIGWYETRTGDIIINQNLYVNSHGHKKILLGEGGKTIKCISMGAGLLIEKLLQRKVHLYLSIKVKSNSAAGRPEDDEEE